MKACIIRKVVYRASDKRPRWAFVLAEREGLALRLAPSNKDGQCHSLVIGAENVAEKAFEDANQSRFPLEGRDMEGIGSKLTALAGGLAEDEVERWLKDEGLW